MPRTKEQFAEMREKTRGKILEVSLNLFAENGFASTSMNDIAKAAGVSKGLAYNYFSSKKDILHSLLGEMLHQAGFFEEMMKDLKDPYEILNQTINLSFDMVDTSKEMWKLYTAVALQPKVLDELKDELADFTSKYFKLFEKLFRKIGLKNPGHEARLFGAIFDGVFFHYLVSPETYPLKGMKKHLLKTYSKEELTKKMKTKT